MAQGLAEVRPLTSVFSFTGPGFHSYYSTFPRQFSRKASVSLSPNFGNPSSVGVSLCSMFVFTLRAVTWPRDACLQTIEALSIILPTQKDKDFTLKNGDYLENRVSHKKIKSIFSPIHKQRYLMTKNPHYKSLGVHRFMTNVWRIKLRKSWNDE